MSGRRVELSVHPDDLVDEASLRQVVARRLQASEGELPAVRLVRRAIDARRGRVRVRIVVDVGGDESPALPKVRSLPTLHGEPQVVIVGAGPAGLFCAWELASLGIRSRVLERGKPVRARRRDLALLSRRGELDPDSNYCYGEGGAGTFSDGKLYTRADKRGPTRDVLEAFVAYGAPPEILVDARPHIGTNRLPTVITNMREHLEAAGVELLFGHRAEGLEVRGGRVAAVRLAAGERIEVPAVVVAPGHSARDVHAWVREAGALVRFKPFAMGVRVEHRQSAIDRIQFGDLAGHPVLGAASYRIVERVAGLGVFSFCMCPGGIIAPAATEPEGLVVNGWSPSSRRGRFANSGFVVEIDGPMVARMGFDASDPMVGIAVQRSFERRAFAAGGGAFVAPAQRLDDFVHSRASTDLPSTSYPRGIRCGDLGEILQPLAAPLRQALAAVSRRMPGYVGHEAVAVALESRTSCPVRIERDPTSGCAIGCDGLFPCGEGAGYAGGIMSAALDGIKIARSLAAFLSSRPHFAEPPW